MNVYVYTVLSYHTTYTNMQLHEKCNYLVQISFNSKKQDTIYVNVSSCDGSQRYNKLKYRNIRRYCRGTVVVLDRVCEEDWVGISYKAVICRKYLLYARDCITYLDYKLWNRTIELYLAYNVFCMYVLYTPCTHIHIIISVFVLYECT